MRQLVKAAVMKLGKILMLGKTGLLSYGAS